MIWCSHDCIGNLRPCFTISAYMVQKLSYWYLKSECLNIQIKPCEYTMFWLWKPCFSKKLSIGINIFLKSSPYTLLFFRIPTPCLIREFYTTMLQNTLKTVLSCKIIIKMILFIIKIKNKNLYLNILFLCFLFITSLLNKDNGSRNTV